MRAQSCDFGKPRVEHDFRIDINGCVEPDFLLVFELNLFLVDGDTIRHGGEVLVVVLGEGLIQWWMAARIRLTPNHSQRSRHSASDAAARAAHTSLISQAGAPVRFASKNGTSGEFAISTLNSLSMVTTASKNSAQFDPNLAALIARKVQN